MPLSVGDKIGHYEVLSLLGQGGMGEVYRARDTTLKRDVALKVLPATFLRDHERMARFQREAEVLASLDHPHIGPIHGMVDSEDSRALVLALIEGPTLADRIAAGPLSQDEAVAIAKQIIEALEYAHDRGVVHRDLKPANIKITSEGVVKVLDFGLAKVLEDDPPASSLINSPTLTMGHTRTGVILGTAAYMSPEQAVGRPVDRRSDIFSFGAVLYEMLTRQRAFAGETTPDVLEAVVKNDPDWSKLPADTPGALRQLLRRCLTKDRKRRLQAIGEARLILEDPQSDTPASVAPRTAPSPRFRWLWPALAAMFAIAAVALAFLHLGETRPVEHTLRFTIPVPERSVIQSLAVSPDGHYLVIAAEIGGKRQLWLRAMDAEDGKPMPGTEDALHPFWSPDSRFIGFFAQGKLKKIAATGGPAETICETLPYRGGSWNKDDVIVFSKYDSGVSAIRRVPASGGTPVDVLKGAHRFPVFLPDGQHFLFLDAGGPPDKTGVYVASLDGKETRRILVNASSVVFAPPTGSNAYGRLFFLREGSLMAQSFDTVNAKLLGDAVPTGENASTINFDYMPVTVSTNGLLVYYSGGDSNTSVQIAWFDRAGKPAGTVTPPGHSSGPAISPDERTVAFQRSSTSGADIWLHNVARGLDTRLTVVPSLNSSPFWSGNGDRVAFHSNRDGTTKLYQRSVNGFGQDELLPSGPGVMNQWSKDGQFIVYVTGGGKGDYDVGVLSMKEGAPADRKPTLFLHSPFNEYHGQLSPDSHWMAYSSDESGQREVYVVPFPAGGAKTQISTAGGEQPRWRGDGKELFYVAPDGMMTAVPVRAGSGAAPSFEAGAPVRLFETHIYRIIAAPTLYQYDVTAGGDRFAIATKGETVAPPLNVVTNWPALLKK